MKKFTFVYKEIGKILLNQNSGGSMRIVVGRLPFVSILLRVELHAVDGVLFVFEAGYEPQASRVTVERRDLPVVVQTRQCHILQRRDRRGKF
jgi:hypothetical protein